MKAARLYEYDEYMNVDLKLERVPEPTIAAADEVIVRIGAAGLCRTDLHIIEGVWRRAMDPNGTLLPYILGHENAGWVEDMYCERGIFPGLNADGGFADYLLTPERAFIKLNEHVVPVAVAPLADSGITAYRVTKRAATHLNPGSYCVVLGVGGLGHVALQALHALCSTRTIAIDRSEAARTLAQELGAQHVLDGGPNVVAAVQEITKGGAHAVIDFVGELGANNSAGRCCARAVHTLSSAMGAR